MMPARLAALGVVALLAGCSDANLDQLDATLADIRRAPSQQAALAIAAIPPPVVLNYQYSDARSPFLAPGRPMASATIAPGTSALAPDTQRPLEPLEAFALQSLRLVGTLEMGGRRLAMIATPDGNVTSVREGNHLGANYGQITRITRDEVRLLERVFDEREGWRESPAALSLAP
ncbi:MULTISPECIES: pilus assembly protein PilP [unclassified Halomonas]|uniref:pilus assembly protein PilP n=1 Tax=unclassified Halomonas TaxID=2609666 RepID=UPI00209D1B1B|nr:MULTISPECIES: pilus assembly protein PilP [unclassified Halomonas]MCP1314848.1 pilus assembly protein PilP [Halomonas sp. 707D7]MCP1328561.1 pilus assembly protein PilP [Halomonas sp. 707D4]